MVDEYTQRSQRFCIYAGQRLKYESHPEIYSTQIGVTSEQLAFTLTAVEGSTLWLLTGHKLTSSQWSRKCWRVPQQDHDTRKISSLNLISYTFTHMHTHCPFWAVHRYEGGRWWMAPISWMERQERVKWTVLVLRSMYAHTLFYFFPRGHKKKGKEIWVSLQLLFLVSCLILILPQRQKNSKDQLYKTTTNKQTSSCVSFIYQCPIHLQLSDLEQSHLATINLDRQIDKLAGEKFLKRVPSVYFRVKGAQRKWEKADLVTLTSHCQTLAEVYLGSCCLAWDSDGVGIQYTALPRQPTQTSALPPHHHFAQHQTTKLACSAAPMANTKN